MKLRWRDISISKKLYGVVGVMAFLICGELLTLSFAMDILSAVRAFVGGEASWSKAQKNAAFSLQQYAITRDERNYQAYLAYLSIPEGDHRARLELAKARPDLAVIREGFIAGHIHPDDIDPMYRLLRRFSRVSYLARAVEVWTEADGVLDEFKASAEEFHRLIQAGQARPDGRPDPAALNRVLAALRDQNMRLTEVEEEFSRALGEGSRWLEHIIVTLLFFAVLTVETIGLTLTFFTSRAISRGLDRITAAAHAIGHGDFRHAVQVESRDEIGRLGQAINEMGTQLERSYREIELRISERTAELARALSARNEFLSIASHELKTPLTSLKLQSQLRLRLLDKYGPSRFDAEQLRDMLRDDDKQIGRLNRCVEDMLDVARVSTGKLTLQLEDRVDLGEIVREVHARLAPQLEENGTPLTMDLAPDAVGRWDAYRLEQVVTNLVTNAMKYGRGQPIHAQVAVERDATGEWDAILRVRDQGLGIPAEARERVFQQFERVHGDPNISGLGLGLYIARQIVQLQGGTIAVDSEVGRGSEFIVRLPLRNGGAGA